MKLTEDEEDFILSKPDILDALADYHALRYSITSLHETEQRTYHSRKCSEYSQAADIIRKSQTE
jgi:hypothetical protein